MIFLNVGLKLHTLLVFFPNNFFLFLTFYFLSFFVLLFLDFETLTKTKLNDAPRLQMLLCTLTNRSSRGDYEDLPLLLINNDADGRHSQGACDGIFFLFSFLCYLFFFSFKQTLLLLLYILKPPCCTC
jgi:hypothetical protein